MVCIICGRSIIGNQRHKVERHNSKFQPASHQSENMDYVCHPCWMWHQRELKNECNGENVLTCKPEPVDLPKPEVCTSKPESEDVPEPENTLTAKPEPEPKDVPEPEITLPNYKRFANTSSHCIFNRCMFEEDLNVIPSCIKKVLFIKYKLYIPDRTRMCTTHLKMKMWHVLRDNYNMYSNFTQNQIEDMIGIVKS